MAGALFFMGLIVAFSKGILCAQHTAINCKEPLNEQQLIGLLKGGVADVRVQGFVNECDIGFANTPEVEKHLPGSGGFEGCNRHGV
jgi:hypothetical protein